MVKVKNYAPIDFYEVLTDLFCDFKSLKIRGDPGVRKDYLDRIAPLLKVRPDQSCDFARKVLENRREQSRTEPDGSVL